ncbi:MAG: RNB domain-containing ribonuclease, partial [Burkholderiaceae bacterium]
MPPTAEGDAPDLALIAAQEMRAHGLQPVFAPEVLQEALQRGVDNDSNIRDLRSRLWFSIDNDDTQDLDQLSWAEALADGGVRLAVAVADVDALVAAGSAVDAHAAAN